MAELILPSGHVVLIDDADLAAVLAAGPWHVHRPRHVWYVRRRLSYTRYQLLHQLLTAWPMTDHINGDGLDNRRANLRPATLSQNGANARTPKDNSSGFKGVFWHKARKRWVAAIRLDRRKINLGVFDTPEATARAYDAAAIAAWGEYARPNFPRTES
jgi:hypothetical protein